MQRYKKELFKRYGSISLPGHAERPWPLSSPAQVPTGGDVYGKFDASWFDPKWRTFHARMMSGITFAREHGRLLSCAETARDCLRNCAFVRKRFRPLP